MLPSHANDSAVEAQREYYERTAAGYDAAHTEPEHILALHLLAAFIEKEQINSILDVGAGTGRAMVWLKQRFPKMRIFGAEPVKALREQAYRKGISPDHLLDCSGDALPFEHSAFDLVCEFAVLHHVRNPDKVIAEMTRVSSKMIAISDCNFLGQGSALVRALKLGLFSSGLWSFANWLKTSGKGYTVSEEDGLAYSYSVFQSLPAVRAMWNDVRIMSTGRCGDRFAGPAISAAHVLLIAREKVELTC
jgi:ubiquinone/menaquinone biosynthesis C-methylase UbiE